MEYREYTGKTVEDAVMEAAIQLETSSDKLEYEVLDKGSSGFLGIGSRPAKIRACKVLDRKGIVEEFLKQVFGAMNMVVQITIEEDQEENTLNIDLAGDDMGTLIGKRGQTLDSLQYLVSLVANKGEEDYRNRRKETLENLAKNIASKAKRTGKPVVLEPMNPYERRVIHSALQNDKYVETHSEGEEPFRRVVVTLKEGVQVRPHNNNRNRRYGNNNRRGNWKSKSGGRE